MEEVKFWTKGKLIFLGVILGIIAIITVSIILYKSNIKKKYIELENQFNYAAPNYLLKEQITLKKDQWRKIDIKDILKQKLVINNLASNCKGYVLAKASKSGSSTNYNTYLSCKNKYKTENYGSNTLSKKTENKSKTQSEKDTKKPVIKLLGKATINVELNSKYTEKGAVATDNVDGDITEKIKIDGKVDTSVVEEYTVTYSVSDKAGNKATKKRKVLVKEKAEKETKDTTEPVITFTSNAVQTICMGTKMDISQKGIYGYSAYDDKDGDITNNVKITGDTGIINSVGSYKLEYTVSDKAKNTFKTERIFNVKDCSEKSATVTAPTPAPTPSPAPSPTPSPSPNPGNNTTTVTPDTKTPTVTVPVRGIVATPNTRTLQVGGSFRITATPTNSNASNKNFNFSSSNSGIASVDARGNVRANSRGSAVITVQSQSNPNITAIVRVNVN